MSGQVFIALINPKSGGNLGNSLLQRFKVSCLYFQSAFVVILMTFLYLLQRRSWTTIAFTTCARMEDPGGLSRNTDIKKTSGL